MFSFRRSLLTGALLLTMASSGLAQSAPATPLLKPNQVTTEHYKQYLGKRYAGDEQATKAIQLFTRRQTGGAIWLGSGAVAIGLVASQTGTKSDGNGGSTTVTVTPLGWGMLLGLFGGVGIGKLARFSNEKLYLALSEYDTSHSFSGYVAKRIGYETGKPAAGR